MQRQTSTSMEVVEAIGSEACVGGEGVAAAAAAAATLKDERKKAPPSPGQTTGFLGGVTGAMLDSGVPQAAKNTATRVMGSLGLGFTKVNSTSKSTHHMRRSAFEYVTKW